MIRYLYDRKEGRCNVCNQLITQRTGYNAHHLQPKYLGGKWTDENLVLLHPVCHIHSSKRNKTVTWQQEKIEICQLKNTKLTSKN